MIRVNLMRNRVQDPTLAGASSVSSTTSSDSNRENALKIALMLLFTIALMVYGSRNIQDLNAQLAELQAQVTDLERQAAAKQKETEGIKDIAVQAQELEDKLKVLKLLSRLRLREVKTLDFMQSQVPEKVWLKNMSYDSDNVRVEQGHFQFKGNAVTTEDLTEFVRRLEESAYLHEVIIIKNQEVAGPNRSSNIRDFLFTAEVEAKN